MGLELGALGAPCQLGKLGQRTGQRTPRSPAMCSVTLPWNTACRSPRSAEKASETQREQQHVQGGGGKAGSNAELYLHGLLSTRGILWEGGLLDSWPPSLLWT